MTPARVVGWYRRDRTRKLLITLVPAMLSMMMGCLIVAHGVTNLAGVKERAARRSTVVYESVEELRSHKISEPNHRSDTRSNLDQILFMVGLGLVALGPMLVIYRLRKALRTEDYLLLRTDGLFYYLEGMVTEISWDDIERFSYNSEEDALVVELEDGEQVLIRERFANLSNAALAKDLETTRRKILWNLLPTGLRR